MGGEGNGSEWLNMVPDAMRVKVDNIYIYIYIYNYVIVETPRPSCRTDEWYLERLSWKGLRTSSQQPGLSWRGKDSRDPGEAFSSY